MYYLYIYKKINSYLNKIFYRFVFISVLSQKLITRSFFTWEVNKFVEDLVQKTMISGHIKSDSVNRDRMNFSEVHGGSRTRSVKLVVRRVTYTIHI